MPECALSNNNKPVSPLIVVGERAVWVASEQRRPETAKTNCRARLCGAGSEIEVAIIFESSKKIGSNRYLWRYIVVSSETRQFSLLFKFAVKNIDILYAHRGLFTDLKVHY